MKKNISVALLVLLAMSIKAQHQEVSDKPEMYKGKQHVTADTTSLLHAFKTGSFRGHFRYFFMSTQNSNGLTDYYANAAGGGIRFETAKFHHFQFAVSGFYIFNIGSSDFTKPDTLTGQNNRYEIGLFDITDPSNKKDLDRLEEFYLKYNYKNSTVILGRQLINTPFINLQDGRMRATGVEGLWLELNPNKKIKIESGWFYGVSPRSTTKWYNPGESIGIYPSGVNPDGTKSQYNNNIKSKTVALLGFTGAVHKNIKLQVWNMFTANVFNTAMLQTDFSFPIKNNASVFAAAQIIKQDAVNEGGNPDQSKTYFLKGSRSLSFGAKAGWKNKQWETSLNYNRITKAGRYLMPREWGRDPFFTFLPRERNDGLGDVSAIVGKANYTISKTRIKISMGVGYYQLPDVKNYTLNKYGLPSYTQINLDIRYTFGKVLQGLEAQFLMAGKSKIGETYNNSKFVINKVNMEQYNFVLNYHF